MISDELRKAARRGPVEVNLREILSTVDAVTTVLMSEASEDLKQELAQDGLALTQYRCKWFLEPLEE